VFENAKEFADLRAGDDEGREKAQGKVVGAIDQQALTQGFGDVGIAVDGELDTEDQAFAANFSDEMEFGGEVGEAFAKFRAACANVFEKLLIAEDVQKFESGGAN
jgi:hypothetical protein